MQLRSASAPVLLLGLFLGTVWASSAPASQSPTAATQANPGALLRGKMAVRAKALLSSLAAPDRARAALDDPERTQWAFGPVQRKGLAIGEMEPPAFAALEALLDTALSESGMAAWRQIRELESVLRRLESTPEKVATHRDPDLYWVRVYGTPAADQRWSWRFEGHHLALHVACEPGKTPTVTPFFLGANPLFEPGADKPLVDGFVTLNGALSELLTALDEPSAMAAMPADSKRPGDIRMGPGRPNLPEIAGGEEGALWRALDDRAKGKLDGLLEVYLGFLDEDLRQYSLAPFGEGERAARFLRWGGTGLRDARTWSILTPEFALELATTDGPHHVHVLLRDVTRDFGGW